MQLLLYAYLLTLLVGASTGSYCRYHELTEYNVSSYTQPINIEEYRAQCVATSLNAAIVSGKLVVRDCASAQYSLDNGPNWQTYTEPVALTRGQSVLVKCGDTEPVLLINPPSLDHYGRGLSMNHKPSVFVVMIDAVSYEAFHRLMPRTLQMLQYEKEFDVFKFTKYQTILLFYRIFCLFLAISLMEKNVLNSGS